MSRNALRLVCELVDSCGISASDLLDELAPMLCSLWRPRERVHRGPPSDCQTHLKPAPSALRRQSYALTFIGSNAMNDRRCAGMDRCLVRYGYKALHIALLTVASEGLKPSARWPFIALSGPKPWHADCGLEPRSR